MPPRKVKQQDVPYHKRPPPVPIPPLPEPDPTRVLSTEKYWQFSRDPNYVFDKYDPTNEIVKKVVINQIEKCPAIWSTRSMTAIQKNFPIVAVETYKRTGVLLSMQGIKSIYKCQKDNLRNRLRVAIISKRLTPSQTEQYMWRWDLYGYMRFYREHTQNWEAELRKEPVGKHVNEKNVDNSKKDNAMDEMDDDIFVEEIPYEDSNFVWDEQKNSNHTPVVKTRQPKQPEDSYYDSGNQMNHHQSKPSSLTVTYNQPGSFSPLQNEKNHSESMRKPLLLNNLNSEFRKSKSTESFNPIPVNDVSSSSFTSIQPSTLVDFREEMSQVTYQATRIARDQPHRVKLLRKALFDVVLAFDQKEYNSVGELFADLAQKNVI